MQHMRIGKLCHAQSTLKAYPTASMLQRATLGSRCSPIQYMLVPVSEAIKSLSDWECAVARMTVVLAAEDLAEHAEPAAVFVTAWARGIRRLVSRIEDGRVSKHC
jgi:hypothetical protein